MTTSPRGGWRAARRAAANLAGIGLGLRWEFLEDVLERPTLELSFLEVSPENYMRRGGYFPECLERLRERYPLVSHGLTMSLGAVDPPPETYMAELYDETRRVGTPWHSDHLCLSTSQARVLHELLPLQLAPEAVRRVADNVKRAEDRLGLPMLVENISFYAHPARPKLPEAAFLCAVLDEADCGLLLDVNNVYVNARNHGYDAQEFIASLPLERVVEVHIAGYKRLPAGHLAEGMLLDTHGSPVSDPVKELLRFTLERTGPVPVLLERDNDVPEFDVLLDEVRDLRAIYDAAVLVHGTHLHGSEGTPT